MVAFCSIQLWCVWWLVSNWLMFGATMELGAWMVGIHFRCYISVCVCVVICSNATKTNKNSLLFSSRLGRHLYLYMFSSQKWMKWVSARAVAFDSFSSSLLRQSDGRLEWNRVKFFQITVINNMQRMKSVLQVLHLAIHIYLSIPPTHCNNN